MPNHAAREPARRWKTRQIREQFDGASRGALLRQNELLSAASAAAAAPRDRPGIRARAVVNSAPFRTTRAASSAKSNLDHVAKILRVGPEQKSRPVAGRLDHVLAAAIGRGFPRQRRHPPVPSTRPVRPAYPRERAVAASARRWPLEATAATRRSGCDVSAASHALRSSRATSSKRSLCRGTTINRKLGDAFASARGTRRARPLPRVLACCRQ